MDFYTRFYTIMIQVFEQGVISDITTRNCNRHTQGPLRLDLLLSESFSESESTSESTSESILEALLEAQARHSCQCHWQCRMQRVRNAQYTRPSYLGHLARLAPRTVVLQAQQPLGHLVARGGREVVGPLACLDPNGERPVRLGPRLGAAPREVQRAGPVWKSTSELGYPEKYCVDLREPPRHRTDAVTGDNVASMA